MLVPLLQNVGWRIASSSDVACLQHLDSGVFIEIPALAETMNMPKLNEFTVDVMCDEDYSYELWFGDRVLSQGLGVSHEVHNIVLTASDLYHELDKAPGAVDPAPGKGKKLRINAVGALTLELMVLTRSAHHHGKSKGHHSKEDAKKTVKPVINRTGSQADGRSLLYVSYIRINKGFRIGMSPMDSEGGEQDDMRGGGGGSSRGGGSRGGNEDDQEENGEGGGGTSSDMCLEMEERVVMGGLVRVITYLEDELGTICEVYEKNGLGSTDDEASEEEDKGDEDEEEEDGGKGAPPFSPVVVSINTVAARPNHIAHPTHDQRHKHGEHAHKQRVPATHLRLCDHAAGVQNKDNTKISEHKYEVMDTLKTISGVKTFHLRQPQLDKDTDPHRSARDFEIYMIRRSIQCSDLSCLRTPPLHTFYQHPLTQSLTYTSFINTLTYTLSHS